MLILIIHFFISIRAENSQHGRFNIRWQPTEGLFSQKWRDKNREKFSSFFVKQMIECINAAGNATLLSPCDTFSEVADFSKFVSVAFI